MGAAWVRVDQLAFGYDDGHRLLRGSRELPPAVASRLLGATDAAPAGPADRLVTGVPLPSENAYALCFTWSAPELPRPGAVWAHVLLVDAAAIRTMQSPIDLASLARRPTTESLDSYSHPLEAQRLTPSPAAPPAARETVAAAAFASGGGPAVAVMDDLDSAQAALGNVWSLLWPGLREQFGFRTRDAVRTASVGDDVVVARRLQGPRPSKVAAGTRPELPPPLDDPPQLQAFLRRYGPFDGAGRDAVLPLAWILEAVGHGDALTARTLIEARYPRADDGAKLKRDLFGADIPDWARERDVTLALLAAEPRAWDRLLRLPDRLRGWISRDGAAAVASALPTPLPKTTLRSLTAALRGAPLSDLAPFATAHPGAVAGAAAASADVTGRSRSWRPLPAAAAEDLLSAVHSEGALTSDAVAAAVRGGQIPAVLRIVGLMPALTLLAEGDQPKAVRALLQADPPTATAWEGTSNAAVIAAAAHGKNLPPGWSSTCRALELHRSNPDTTWLRAAVAVLRHPDTDQSAAMQTVFGPLHHAITADRLPRECWDDLDLVLPKAPDPALRLRRHLLKIGRQYGWGSPQMSAALRDAGPFSEEVLRDFEHHDEWYISVLKMALHAVGFR